MKVTRLFSRKNVLVNLLCGAICAAVLSWYLVFRTENLFSNEGFMPHGHCYLWTPGLVSLMVATDLLIGLAYVSISACLYILVRRIRLPFSAMFLAFGLFIAACGMTHFMEVYTLWVPNYWLAAMVKLITAIASVATAVILFPLFPRVVAFAESARLSEIRKEQLETLNTELEGKTAALEAAYRELETFSYSVSHDLRGPLRGIHGFARALTEDYGAELNDEGQEYIKNIRSAADRMSQIIEDLLKLSRINRAELNFSALDITDLAVKTAAVLRTSQPSYRPELVIQKGLVATGDAGLIRIVLENLISNAWKFSGQNPQAKIEFGREAGEFFVRDNGVGFDMRFASKLFGAFQRLHRADEYPGTGIGLATARRIIERHHGSIRVDSVLGQGTTFYFTLAQQPHSPLPQDGES